MKILLTQRMIYVPTFGGSNKCNRVLLEEFSRVGHKCRAVVPAFGSHGPDGITAWVEALKSRGATMVSATGEAGIFRYHGVEVHAVFSPTSLHEYLLDQMRSFQPDWAFVSCEDPGQTLLRQVLRVARERTVCIAQTPLQLPFGPHAFELSAEGTELMRQAAGIITVSKYIEEYIRRWGGADSAVLPFPVYGSGSYENLGRFDRGFVTLVNPCAYKGISIFADMVTRLPEIAFAVVPSWGTTEADLALLKGYPQVTVLNPVDDIGGILERTRVLLLPSLWLEAFPLLPVEAMLRGIPVIASNVGGLPEAKLGVDYILPVCPIQVYQKRFDEREYPVPIVPPQPVTLWTETLRQLLSDPDRYKRLSVESYNVAREFVAGIRIETFELFLSKLQISAAPRSPSMPDTQKDMPGERISGSKRTLLALSAWKRNAVTNKASRSRGGFSEA